MQDRYAGDVGDFGKFGLLRHLCGVTAQDKHGRFEKPGVIWYKTEPGKGETGRDHGKFIRYLDESDENNRRFKACDKDLYVALRHIVNTGRTIEALQKVLAGQCPDFRAGVPLLPDALYWPNDVRHGKKKSTCPRADWFQTAFEATAECDLVFLDPDNGIECENLRPTQGDSRKYVFRCEVGKLIARGQSVVVYHHPHYSVAAEKQVRQHLRMLADKIALPDRPFAVLFHRWGTRAFLILPVHKHYAAILERTKALVKQWDDGGKAGPHFTGPIF
jgi:hypothetical protein